MDKLMAILSQVRSDVDFTKEKALIDDVILDSFDIVSIIAELSEAFEVTISIDDMTPDNFNSAEAMYNLVERILDEE